MSPDPYRNRRDHPPRPPADRLTMAQAQPSAPLLVLAYLREGETFAECFNAPDQLCQSVLGQCLRCDLALPHNCHFPAQCF